MGNYFKSGPVVQETSFKEKIYGRWTDAQRMKTDHNSSPLAFGSGELIRGIKGIYYMGQAM